MFVDDYVMTPKEIAYFTKKVERDNAKRINVRLYYKTPNGKIKTKDFLAWFDNSINDFRYWFGVHKSSNVHDMSKVKTLSNKELTYCQRYMPYGCKAIKLVRVFKNGAEKLLLKGQR